MKAGGDLPVLEEYAKKTNVVRINASKSIKEVAEEIKDALR
jgi:adenylate kinase family enzyme